MALVDEGHFTRFWDAVAAAIVSGMDFVLVGINAAGIAALAAGTDVTLQDLIDDSYITHGPTTVTLSYLAGLVDGEDLVETFLDNDNGNGDTDAVLLINDTGVATTSYAWWFSVLDEGIPQDGTDDNAAWNALGIWRFYS